MKRIPRTASPASIKPEAIVTIKRKWYGIFFMLSLMVAIAGSLVAVQKPEAFQQLQGNLLALMEAVQSNPLSQANPSPDQVPQGIMIMTDQNGNNETKLKEIFASVFSTITLEEVDYRSPRGQDLIRELGVTEIPNVFFKKTAFESEELAASVSDLFTLRGEYYGLNVSLVNPSHQVFITGSPSDFGSIQGGSDQAPLSVYLYSDVNCQECRAAERNMLPGLQQLVDAGTIRVVFMDMPQDEAGGVIATDLTCYYDQKKDATGYLNFRNTLLNRVNLTPEFAAHELDQLGVHADTDCNRDSYQDRFRNRAKIVNTQGITAVPAAYIGETGGKEFIRLTGLQDLMEVQTIVSGLLRGK